MQIRVCAERISAVVFEIVQCARIEIVKRERVVVRGAVKELSIAEPVAALAVAVNKQVIAVLDRRKQGDG